MYQRLDLNLLVPANSWLQYKGTQYQFNFQEELMGCQCSTPIDKKEYMAQQKGDFGSYGRKQRVEVSTERKNHSRDSTDDELSTPCKDKKCKKKSHMTCKGFLYEETMKKFELSHDRIKKKSRQRNQSIESLQQCNEMEQSVVVSIYNSRHLEEEVQTIMNELKV